MGGHRARPLPLHQANAFNVLAAIAVAEGDRPAAIAAAANAYKAAWCDGPPYAYHWGLEKAKAHLAALGAPEPVLPPFDESKFQPMPNVEINPKDKYWVDPDSWTDYPSLNCPSKRLIGSAQLEQRSNLPDECSK